MITTTSKKKEGEYKMNWEEYEKSIDSLFYLCKTIIKSKGYTYAHGENPLGNFNRLSQILGIDRKRILLIYFYKHLDAIIAYINGQREDTEDIKSRIADAINYLAILYTMIMEDERNGSED